MGFSRFLKKGFYSSLSNTLLKNFRILKYYNTSKTVVGICLYNNQKCFFKFVNNASQEIRRINLLKPIYKIPKVIDTINNTMIIYEYLEDFKSATLNDYLYSNVKNTNLNQIFNQYKVAIENTICLFNESCSQSYTYFQKRVYYLYEYINQIPYRYIVFNNKQYDIKLIFKEILEIIMKNKKIHMIVSQGDPTDTNITITGYFTDFENAGLNSLLSEFSILFVSLFSHGRYFYPKYNEKAYAINKSILNKFDDYKIKINYHIEKDCIYVNNIQLNLPNKNKQIILKLIDVYLNNLNYKKYKKDFKYLKYYICMRVLTPINILLMDIDDKISILILMVLCYDKINDLESLERFIGDINGNV